MGLVPINLLSEPQKILGLISQRQEALSDNIANMHTVGYKRKDVDFAQYLNNTNSVSDLEIKTIEKYGPSPIISTIGGNEKKTTEEELVLMQENYMLYNAAVQELSSTLTEIKTVLNISAS